MAAQQLNVTMQTVAREAGVSRATVSRVMSESANVDDAARKKVLAAVRKLGYVRNAAAAQLARRSSNLVGLLLRDAVNPAYALLQDHLLRQAHTYGLFMVTASTGQLDSAIYPAEEVNILNRLLELRPSGLIIASGVIAAEEILPFATQIPTIVVPRPEPNETLHVVGYDEVANSTRIATEVARAGHRRVAVTLVPEACSRTENLRARTMVETLKAAGVSVTRLRGAKLLDDPAATFARIMSGVDQGRYSAVMFCNDVRALRFIAEARRHDVAIPERVSVTGIDGTGLAGQVAELTTIRSPLEQVAAETMATMTRLIEADGQTEPVKQLFPGTLVAGRTLAAL